MFSDLLYRVRALLGRNRVEHELDDELQFHLEKQAEKHIDAGCTAAEAERLARIQLGGFEQVKEECRQSRGITFVETLLRDVAYAVWMLRKSPVFAAAVVLSLALGIGANTAIFTLIDAALWRMLPVRDPEGLLAVGRQLGAEVQPGFSYQEYRYLHDNIDTADLAGYAPAEFSVSINGNLEPTIQGQLVTGDYFSLLGVQPVVGRAIGPDDNRVPNGHPVAMLSYGYWERRFAHDPEIVGRTIHLLDRPFTVIGVTPPEFFGVELGAAPEVFVPMMMQPAVMPSFENLLRDPIIYRTWVGTVARVKPGVAREQAAAIMSTLYWRLNRERAEDIVQNFPGTKDRNVLTLTPAAAVSQLRRQFSRPLFILMIVVALVLLIACANTANLLLARAAARQPEFSLRLAMGASRGRLARQLLVESLVLATLSGVCGALLARWTTQLLVAYISSGRAPIVLDLTPNPRVLLFTLAVSVLTAILFGMAPAVQASRTNLTQPLRSLRGSAAGSRGKLVSQKMLAVMQVTLSLILLVGTGLFVRTLYKLGASGGDVPRHDILVARVEPRGSDQRGIPGTSARLDRTYRQLISRVNAISEVRSVSMAQVTPTVPIGTARVSVPNASGENVTVPAVMVYPNYFQTIGIAFVAGRDFNPRDLATAAPTVCIVNEAFVREYFPGENPIGQPCMIQARPNVSSAPGPFYARVAEPYSIVGVVRDSRYMNPRGKIEPLVYMTFLQTPTGRGQMVLFVRANGDIGPLLPRIRGEVARVDPSLPLSDVRTLGDEMDAALVQQRLIAMLTSLFGGLALLLACIGIYGLVTFSVVQRTAEIGIRAALGARPGSVLWFVMREALVLVALGISIGAPLALLVAHVASKQIPDLLFGIEATDPLTIGSATTFLISIAALAAYLPAKRASRIDPMVALRSE